MNYITKSKIKDNLIFEDIPENGWKLYLFVFSLLTVVNTTYWT